MTWGDHKKWPPAERLREVTSVNVRHAKRRPDGKWDQEKGKWYVVPKSKELSKKWQSFVDDHKKSEIVWNPYDDSSLPGGEQGKKGVEDVYGEARKVIKAGDSLCSSAMLTYNLAQTQTAMRGGGEIEYEVVGVAEDVGGVGVGQSSGAPHAEESERPLDDTCLLYTSDAADE